MHYTLDELRGRIDGLLAFPVTPFDDNGGINRSVLRDHVRALVDGGVAAIFAACGTGEFVSLDAEEYEVVIRACVEEVGGEVPVLAGLGYGAGLARALAERGMRAGADGFLVMPPYLLTASQEGLETHYRLLANDIPAALILYQRDNAVFAPDTIKRLATADNIIGLKDGIGNTEQLAFLVDILPRDRFLLLNGLPTAELHVANFALYGLTTYSSAILNFMPDVAFAFFRALRAGDFDTVAKLQLDVIIPLSRIRARAPGYAVSVVKCGARLRGLNVGPVRPPLVELAPDDEADLWQLMEKASALVRAA